jgi:hypothetical protein
MRSRASIAIGPSQRSFNGSTCTYRRALSTPHGLLPSDYQDQRPEHRAHAVRGHRGRRPPSLKKGGRSEARHGPPRRPKRLTRQRLGPGTSRGRPGARHPPLRCDTATPGRLPGDLRRRLEHDGQARCSRPGWASLVHRCPGLLPSRSLPARLRRLAPAARQKKKSGSTPWVVGACVTGGGQRMSE